jgi:hypothetical protein
MLDGGYMTRGTTWVVVTAALLCAPSGLAQAPERLTDRDVKELIEAVDHARDRFEDQLDGKVKNTVVRGATTEVNVSRFLDDLQENVGRLKDRFKPDYAASAEVAAVLRQGTSIGQFMKQQPSDLKGASEWDRLASNLGRLAAAYGATFPLDADASVRRVSDGEAAALAKQIQEQAEGLKDAVNRAAGMQGPAKTALKGAADAIKNRAKALESRLKDSKPATAEARQLFEAVQKFDEAVKGSPAAAPAMSVMGSMRAPLSTLRQAFGMSAPAGT